MQENSVENFFSDSLIENEIQLGNNKKNGTIKEMQLSGMLVVLTDTQVPNGYSFTVSNDFPLFKLYFGLNGTYTNVINKTESSFTNIPKGHFNFLYQPYVDSKVAYEGNRQRNLQIIFTKKNIQHLLGNDYEEQLKKISDVIAENNNCIFWKESKIIPNKYLFTIEDILNCTYKGQIRKVYIEAKVTELIVDFLLMTKEKYTTNRVHNLEATNHAGVQKVEDYISKNLKKRITIKKLATHVGFNVSKLKREFKKINHITIFKYITRLRMEKAKRFIEEGNYSISQASYEVGYKNPQHFTVAFKKTHGFLPSQLRK